MNKALAAIPLGLVFVACSAAPGLPGTGGPTGAPSGAAPTPASTTQVVPGGWSGTISFHAVANSDETVSSESGDPGSVYHTTSVSHDVLQVDASDVVTVTGTDDEEDAIYGIGSVELTGPASNSGTAFEQHIITTDKYNSLGCHYTQELGTEVSGSWSQAGSAGGEINFNEDGSYSIDIGASSADPVTGEYESLKLPKTLWETFTILEGAAQDCPVPGRSEVTDTEGPIFDWANSLAGSLEGQIDPANPGSVVDGSATFEVESPEATVTVTWHLVHDGPIIVTPQEFPEE